MDEKDLYQRHQLAQALLEFADRGDRYLDPSLRRRVNEIMGRPEEEVEETHEPVIEEVLEETAKRVALGGTSVAVVSVPVPVVEQPRPVLVPLPAVKPTEQPRPTPQPRTLEEMRAEVAAYDERQATRFRRKVEPPSLEKAVSVWMEKHAFSLRTVGPQAPQIAADLRQNGWQVTGKDVRDCIIKMRHAADRW